MINMTSSKLFVGLLIVFCLIACENSKNYVPQDLRKLSKEEISERLAKGDMPAPSEVLYRMPDGTTISFDSVYSIPNIQDFTTDSYVNEDGRIIEMVLRKMTPEESTIAKAELQKWEEEQKQAAIDQVHSLPIVPVDCNDLVNILDRVYHADQDSRRNGGGYDPDEDMQNLQMVISIIKKCGMPTVASTNQQSMLTIWLVFQHSTHEFRKAYYPLLQVAAENGDIEATNMAMMEDRLLMIEKKPQIYGTQLRGSGPNGAFELWEITDPEYVNQRRAEVGFGPLEEYVAKYGLEFNVPQKEK